MPFYFLLIYRKWLIFAIYAKSFWVFREKLHRQLWIPPYTNGNCGKVKRRGTGNVSWLRGGISRMWRIRMHLSGRCSRYMMYMERNIRRFWMKLRQGRSETGGEESQNIPFFPSPAVDTGNQRKNSMQGNL